MNIVILGQLYVIDSEVEVVSTKCGILLIYLSNRLKLQVKNSKNWVCMIVIRMMISDVADTIDDIGLIIAIDFHAASEMSLPASS